MGWYGVGPGLKSQRAHQSYVNKTLRHGSPAGRSHIWFRIRLYSILSRVSIHLGNQKWIGQKLLRVGVPKLSLLVEEVCEVRALFSR